VLNIYGEVNTRSQSAASTASGVGRAAGAGVPQQRVANLLPENEGEGACV